MKSWIFNKKTSALPNLSSLPIICPFVAVHENFESDISYYLFKSNKFTTKGP